MRQCRIIGSMELFFTRTYERAIKKLVSKESREAMETTIAADPIGAPVIRGTGGIRKFRWPGSGRGKRGGIRTLYFYHANAKAIYLLTAYAKASREEMTSADRKILARLVATIKKEEVKK